jgi:N-hydroxyarylamine O-acetyltransferase
VDDAMVEAYLTRIGAARPAQRDAAALRALQERHLDAVPFENLSIHLGEPIGLAPDALLDKLVTRGRGGFCYELNGAFALLLEALGFTVTRLSARVFDPEGALGPPFDHLALRVDLAEPMLVDVGFGSLARRPLRLDARDDQADAAGTFRLREAPYGDVDVIMDGTPQYRLEMRPRDLADFAATCWWQQTAPDSHFARSLTCSLPTPAGRVTLSGHRLVRTEHGRRTETELGSDGEVLDAYRDLFGIRLETVPVDPRRTRPATA